MKNGKFYIAFLWATRKMNTKRTHRTKRLNSIAKYKKIFCSRFFSPLQFWTPPKKKLKHFPCESIWGIQLIFGRPKNIMSHVITIILGMFLHIWYACMTMALRVVQSSFKLRAYTTQCTHLTKRPKAHFHCLLILLRLSLETLNGRILNLWKHTYSHSKRSKQANKPPSQLAIFCFKSRSNAIKFDDTAYRNYLLPRSVSLKLKIYSLCSFVTNIFGLWMGAAIFHFSLRWTMYKCNMALCVCVCLCECMFVPDSPSWNVCDT